MGSKKVDYRSVLVGHLAISLIACDHALSLYFCNLFSGGGHDTFLSQITCKKKTKQNKTESGLFSDWIGNNADD